MNIEDGITLGLMGDPNDPTECLLTDSEFESIFYKEEFDSGYCAGDEDEE